MSTMFTPEFRAEVEDALLDSARRDPRIVGAAVVGSLALDGGDAWSDLDLTFGTADGADVAEVMADWSKELAARFDALQLFDLPAGETIYRVFLLPGGLQVDLSFAPAASFGAGSPRFRLVFGAPQPKQPPEVRAASDIFGWGIAYVRDAYASIERGRPWRAEHSIGEVRHHAFQLACRRHGLPLAFGRGLDELPAGLLSAFAATLVTSLERPELLRALDQAVTCLLREADEVRDLATRAEPRIREWTAAAGDVR